MINSVDYCLGRYRVGRVPPQLHEIEESPAMVGSKVIVFPFTPGSMFANVTEITPVT